MNNDIAIRFLIFSVKDYSQIILIDVPYKYPAWYSFSNERKNKIIKLHKAIIKAYWGRNA